MDKLYIYIKNPSVVCTELDHGAVLLNLDSKYYYNLNEKGLRIVQIMEEIHSPVEISKRLSYEYEVDAERARACLFKLIEQLEKEELIRSNKGGE